MTTQANILHKKQPNGSYVLTNERTGASITLTADEFALATNRARAAATLRPIEDPRDYGSRRSPAEQLAEERKAKEGSDPEPLRPAPPAHDPLGRYGFARAAAEAKWQEWKQRDDARKARTQKLSDDERLAGMVAKHITEMTPAAAVPELPPETPEQADARWAEIWRIRREATLAVGDLKNKGGTPEQIYQAECKVAESWGLPLPEQPTPTEPAAQEQSNGE